MWLIWLLAGVAVGGLIHQLGYWPRLLSWGSGAVAAGATLLGYLGINIPGL